MTDFSSHIVTLYHTDGCHICEQAEALLKQTPLSYQKVDIMSDQRLIDLYSCTIPVLKSTAENHESVVLYWPFSLEQLQTFKREQCHY